MNLFGSAILTCITIICLLLGFAFCYLSFTFLKKKKEEGSFVVFLVIGILFNCISLILIIFMSLFSNLYNPEKQNEEKQQSTSNETMVKIALTNTSSTPNSTVKKKPKKQEVIPTLNPSPIPSPVNKTSSVCNLTIVESNIVLYDCKN